MIDSGPASEDQARINADISQEAFRKLVGVD